MNNETLKTWAEESNPFEPETTTYETAQSLASLLYQDAAALQDQDPEPQKSGRVVATNTDLHSEPCW